MKLAYSLENGAPVCYFDESAFISWTRMPKTWFHRSKKLMIPLASKRGSGFTLFGCVGNCLRQSTFLIGTATSNLEVLRFFRSLVRAKRDPRSRPFLILDNAGAHRSPHVLPFITQHFRPLFMPGYSCQFNSIGKPYIS